MNNSWAFDSSANFPGWTGKHLAGEEENDHDDDGDDEEELLMAVTQQQL